MRFRYGDPPYPGTASRYYRGEPTFAGEVDHVELIRQLEAPGCDGWALSTSAKSLRWLLPLCPEQARVCPWVKPHGVPPASYGLHNAWEALIVVGGRQLPPGVRDWLSALPARGGGELPGRKPLAFCAWLFDCLGMQPGDELEDLFPGTGIVARAWREASLVDARRASPGDEQQAAASLLEPRRAAMRFQGFARSAGAGRRGVEAAPGDATDLESATGSVAASLTPRGAGPST